MTEKNNSADAILKGMLKIGITSSNNDEDASIVTNALGRAETSSSTTTTTTITKKATAAAASAAAASTVIDATTTETSDKVATKNKSRQKSRDGSRGKQTARRSSNNSTNHSIEECEGTSSGAQKIGNKSEKGQENATSAQKKRKKKNTNAVKEGGDSSTTKTSSALTTTAPQHQRNSTKSSSSTTTKHKHTTTSTNAPTTNNYAWSAFQSSPDPSALPDIGALFGNDNSHEKKEGPLESEEQSSRVDDKEDNDEGGTNHDKDSVPSADISASLVHSMIAKNGTNLNTGKELLKRLYVGNKQGEEGEAKSSDKNIHHDVVGNKFRTMESFEAEMLSPSKKENGSNVEREETIGSNAVKRGSSTSNYQHRDPITELMNPGGHPDGFSMPTPHLPPSMTYYPSPHYGGMHPQQQQQAPQPPHPMPYIAPPFSPSLHPQQSFPGYPYPLVPPPMYQSPNSIPPGFTTMQVRVPNVLGPGNTMLVHGMPFAVPEGVPSGAIIPVLIPTHPTAMGGGEHHGTAFSNYPIAHQHHQQQQHHQHHSQRSQQQTHYSTNYNTYQHAQMQHMMQQQVHSNHILGGYNPNPMSQHQHHPHPQSQEQPEKEMNSNSWAAKVAAIPPKGTETDMMGQNIVPPSVAATGAAAAATTTNDNITATTSTTSSTGTASSSNDVVVGGGKVLSKSKGTFNHTSTGTRGKKDGSNALPRETTTAANVTGRTSNHSHNQKSSSIVDTSISKSSHSTTKKNGRKKQTQKEMKG